MEARTIDEIQKEVISDLRGVEKIVRRCSDKSKLCLRYTNGFVLQGIAEEIRKLLETEEKMNKEAV